MTSLQSSAGEIVTGDHGFIATGFGVVHPWLCDVMGHLTTRHYVSFFDDATWHVLAEIGYRPAEAVTERWGWADVQNEVSYIRELAPGTLIQIASRVVTLGKTSLTIESVMQQRGDYTIAARMRAKLVSFDLDGRKARPLPAEIRSTAAKRFGL